MGKCVLETATSPVEKYFSCFNKAQAPEMVQKERLVLYDSFLSTKKSYARLIKCCILLKFFTAVNKRLSCLVLVIRAQCPPTFSLLPFSNMSAKLQEGTTGFQMSTALEPHLKILGHGNFGSPLATN